MLKHSLGKKSLNLIVLFMVILVLVAIIHSVKTTKHEANLRNNMDNTFMVKGELYDSIINLALDKLSFDADVEITSGCDYKLQSNPGFSSQTKVYDCSFDAVITTSNSSLSLEQMKIDTRKVVVSHFNDIGYKGEWDYEYIEKDDGNYEYPNEWCRVDSKEIANATQLLHINCRQRYFN